MDYAVNTYDLYRDIQQRTGGEIYIGVLGPVRTGKSTFIKRFMDEMVLPYMEDEHARMRAQDELPQSAGGKTITTTEPKFIPNEAAKVRLNDDIEVSVRLIDCVGYMIDGAAGHMEEDAERMVKTPWFEEAIPFNMAAEIGTKKVITDHSTIGLVVTTDGSISDIPREEYEEAEERVIRELQEINKPFIVLLNSIAPNLSETHELAASLSKKYGVTVVPVSCMELDEIEIKRILAGILFEFPVKEVRMEMPRWLTNLEKNHWLRTAVYRSIAQASERVEKIRQVQGITEAVSQCEYIEKAEALSVDLGTGRARMSISLKQNLFYQVLGEKTGLAIHDEGGLMDSIMELANIKKKYDQIASAYDDVQQTGYGIVMPTLEELTLQEPEIIKQSGKYGIRLKASAPSIHLMKTQSTTEVTPIVGSEQQSEELVSYLLNEFEEDPTKIWESNIFGKSLNELVNEGLHNKLYRMPEDARMKLKETIERIINDGCNGLICIII